MEFELVSLCMLYKFVWCFDEYEGENYDGLSCCGVFKGWFYNGVCFEFRWFYGVGDEVLLVVGWDIDVIE